MEKKEEPYMTNNEENKKWHGSAIGIVDAPIKKVWNIVSQTSRLHEWMPMVENCTNLIGEEGVPGYTRLVSGIMFPQKDQDRSWIKERLIFMDPLTHNYIYRMESSNTGLDGLLNSLRVLEYDDNSTLVEWTFDINPVEGVSEDYIVDNLGCVYKSCIQKIEGAIKDSWKE